MSRTFKDTKKYRQKLADDLGTIPACIGMIPSYWKKMRRRKRRKKEKSAIRNGMEPPRFKKTDEYDYY